jgi:hypothetical protein
MKVCIVIATKNINSKCIKKCKRVRFPLMNIIKKVALLAIIFQIKSPKKI